MSKLCIFPEEIQYWWLFTESGITLRLAPKSRSFKILSFIQKDLKTAS